MQMSFNLIEQDDNLLCYRIARQLNRPLVFSPSPHEKICKGKNPLHAGRNLRDRYFSVRQTQGRDLPAIQHGHFPCRAWQQSLILVRRQTIKNTLEQLEISIAFQPPCLPIFDKSPAHNRAVGKPQPFPKTLAVKIEFIWTSLLGVILINNIRSRARAPIVSGGIPRGKAAVHASVENQPRHQRAPTRQFPSLFLPVKITGYGSIRSTFAMHMVADQCYRCSWRRNNDTVTRPSSG